MQKDFPRGNSGMVFGLPILVAHTNTFNKIRVYAHKHNHKSCVQMMFGPDVFSL